VSKRKKVLFGLLGLSLALVLLDTWLIYYHTPKWTPNWETTSPDGRYTVSVYSNSGVNILPEMVYSREYIGTVVLRENKTGKVLQREPIGETNDKSIVEWFSERNKVSVTSVDIWDLPPPEPGS